MMAIPINCKRLVEVDFPMVAVSTASAKEKDIKTGSFGAVHVWWARRPLASCLAMNFACMVPDPDDGNCPTALRRIIAIALDKLQRAPGGQVKFEHPNKTWDVAGDGDLSASRNRPKSLRKRLLKFIGEYSRWDLKMSESHTKCARSIIIGCHDGNPKLLDSFAGGGSIPLEGQRLGMEAFASDINPIPLLLNKLQLELLPKLENEIFAKAELELNSMNSYIKNELMSVFDIDGHRKKGEIPIGYLCARQVICEGVDCGVLFPMLSSPWISKTKKQKICYSFHKEGAQLIVGLIGNPLTNQIPIQTSNRGNAICPICNHETSVSSVKKQMKSQKGGANNSRLLIVITKPIDGSGRIFRLPSEKDISTRNNSTTILK